MKSTHKIKVAKNIINQNFLPSKRLLQRNRWFYFPMNIDETDEKNNVANVKLAAELSTQETGERNSLGPCKGLFVFTYFFVNAIE